MNAFFFFILGFNHATCQTSSILTCNAVFMILRGENSSLIYRSPEVGVMVWNIVPSTREDHTVTNPKQHHTPHHHNYACCEGYTSGRVSSYTLVTLKMVTTKHVKISTYVQNTRQLNPDGHKQLSQSKNSNLS